MLLHGIVTIKWWAISDEKVWKLEVVVVSSDTCTYQLHSLRMGCRVLEEEELT